MFNFHKDLAGHDMVTDTGKGIMCRRKLKPHDYKQKYNNEGTFENMGFNGKTVWRFQTKKRMKTKFSTFQKHPKEHLAP